jgi:COP9 signalosome complex subunit 7
MCQSYDLTSNDGPQALEASGVYVFGELLDHPNIRDLEKSESGLGYFRLLKIFAYGTFADYLAESSQLPALTEAMKKKLRLLTVATMATKAKLLRYSDLQKELVHAAAFSSCMNHHPRQC